MSTALGLSTVPPAPTSEKKGPSWDKTRPRADERAVPGEMSPAPPHSRLTVSAQQSLLKAAVLEAGRGNPRRRVSNPALKKADKAPAKVTLSNDAIPNPPVHGSSKRPAQTALKNGWL